MRVCWLQICNNYLEGRCRYGDQCRRIHEGDIPQTVRRTPFLLSFFCRFLVSPVSVLEKPLHGFLDALKENRKSFFLERLFSPLFLPSLHPGSDLNARRRVVAG